MVASKSTAGKPARHPVDPDTPELLAPDFSLRQLSYFVAAAHHQSIQRAARELHVSSPAISEAIAHLEETLGVQLFVRRHARGLVATDAGNALAIECRNLIGQAWALGSTRGTASREVRGWVHLGCLLTFAPYLIPPLLRTFGERYARSRVYWHEGHHEYLMEGLQNGAFELAVLYDFEVPSGIECTALRPAPLQAVLPAGHSLARRKSLGFKALAGEPLVLLDLPSTREYILSAFSSEGVTPKIAYRVQSITMLRSLVASGLGYSLLNFCPPYSDPAGSLTTGSLTTRPLASRLPTPNLVVARSHRYQPTPAALALTECIAGLVKRMEFSAGRPTR